MSVDRRSSVPTPDPGTSSLPPGFTDQVMRAIGLAPRPSPARGFWSAIRDRSIAEAGAALSVAWRIIRRSTTMPVMVRAQALALVVFVAGSMLGGGALAAVVAYQTVGPIVQAISEPAGDRARSDHDAVQMPPSPAPLVVPRQTPVTVEPASPPLVGPDRPPSRLAPNDESRVPGDTDDADEDDPDEADEADDEADDDEADDDEADPDEADEPDGEAGGAGADDPDESDEPDGDSESGESGEADEPSDDAESSGSGDSSDGGESGEVAAAEESGSS